MITVNPKRISINIETPTAANSAKPSFHSAGTHQWHGNTSSGILCDLVAVKSKLHLDGRFSSSRLTYPVKHPPSTGGLYHSLVEDLFKNVPGQNEDCMKWLTCYRTVIKCVSDAYIRLTHKRIYSSQNLRCRT